MIKVAVILADGMEELEALTPVDILRRYGASVDTISIKEELWLHTSRTLDSNTKAEF